MQAHSPALAANSARLMERNGQPDHGACRGHSTGRKVAANPARWRGKTRFPFAPGQLVIPVTREECVPQVG